MLRTIFISLLLVAFHLHAKSPVYVALWFDTEDYIEPAADDAVLRIANDLTKAGVRATFKIVGEKARVLESRGRRDVIQRYRNMTSAITQTGTVFIRPRPSTWSTWITSKEPRNSSAGKLQVWPTSNASSDGSLPVMVNLAIPGDRKAIRRFES